MRRTSFSKSPGFYFRKLIVLILSKELRCIFLNWIFNEIETEVPRRKKKLLSSFGFLFFFFSDHATFISVPYKIRKKIKRPKKIRLHYLKGIKKAKKKKILKSIDFKIYHSSSLLFPLYVPDYPWYFFSLRLQNFFQRPKTLHKL